MRLDSSHSIQYCNNHPDTPAFGRCNVCGKWECIDCCVIYKGEIYCCDTCFPRECGIGACIENAQGGRGKKFLSIHGRVGSLILVILLGSGLVLGTVGIWNTIRLRSASQRIAAMQRKYTRVQAAAEEFRLKYMEAMDRVHVADKERKKASNISIDRPRRQSPPPKVVSPQSGLLSKKNAAGIPLSFDNGIQKKPLVSLTFDGGSFANVADAILDTLASRDVKATMFLTGYFIRRNASLVRRIVTRGHEIGNHTWSHPHLTTWASKRTHATRDGVDSKMIARQLEKTRKVFKEVTNHRLAPLWRAPYGERNSRICTWGRAAGYMHVGWRQGHTWRVTLDTHDWIPDEETPGYRSPDEVMDKIMTLATRKPHGINGGIILMHLGTKRENPDEQVHLILGGLIDSLRNMGYRFVTVGEMARESGINLCTLEPEYVQR